MLNSANELSVEQLAWVLHHILRPVREHIEACSEELTPQAQARALELTTRMSDITEVLSDHTFGLASAETVLRDAVDLVQFLR